MIAGYFDEGKCKPFEFLIANLLLPVTPHLPKVRSDHRKKSFLDLGENDDKILQILTSDHSTIIFCDYNY